MTRFLKTLLHVLSIVVICTAMAACSPMGDSNGKFSAATYSSADGVSSSATSTSIMDY